MSRHLTDTQRAEIGAAVRRARAAGAPWKLLTRIYNRTERQLRRYAGNEDRTFGQMSDLAGCGAHRRAA